MTFPGQKTKCNMTACPKITVVMITESALQPRMLIDFIYLKNEVFMLFLNIDVVHVNCVSIVLVCRSQVHGS